MIVAAIRLSSILLLAVLALPALAGEPRTKTYRIEIPVKVRAEIYLQQSKRKTAARADRLTGKDTFTNRLRDREITKPRRYIPRHVQLKVKETGARH